MSKFLFHTKEWDAMGSELHSVSSPIQTPSPPALTSEALGTELQRYNCSTIRRGNAAKHSCPEAESWQTHHCRQLTRPGQFSATLKPQRKDTMT